MRRHPPPATVPLRDHVYVMLGLVVAGWAALRGVDRESVRLVATEARAQRAQANEWRGSLRDQAERVPSREEVVGMISPLADQIADLRTSRDAAAGTSVGGDRSWRIVAGLIAGGVAVAGLFVSMAAVAVALLVRG